MGLLGLNGLKYENMTKKTEPNVCGVNIVRSPKTLFVTFYQSDLGILLILNVQQLHKRRNVLNVYIMYCKLPNS